MYESICTKIKKTTVDEPLDQAIADVLLELCVLNSDNDKDILYNVIIVLFKNNLV